MLSKLFVEILLSRSFGNKIGHPKIKEKKGFRLIDFQKIACFNRNPCERSKKKGYALHNNRWCLF